MLNEATLFTLFKMMIIVRRLYDATMFFCKCCNIYQLEYLYSVAATWNDKIKPLIKKIVDKMSLADD